MKIALALVLFALLGATSWSDVPPLRPVTITVSNLAAFPQYKFSYGLELVPGQPPKELFALRERAVVVDALAGVVIHLFVNDRSGEQSEWASIRAGFTESQKAYSILDVRGDGKKIKVDYELGSHSRKPVRKALSAALLLTMSAFSLGAVVLLMRRNRGVSAGS